jgi:hypothetical protein
MVSDPVQMPPFPNFETEEPASRSTGAKYAQRVLRMLDNQFRPLKDREAALDEAQLHMTRVGRASPHLAAFVEGACGVLGGAGATLTAHFDSQREVFDQIERSRAKAVDERARLLAGAATKRARAAALRAEADAADLKAGSMEALASSTHARLITYAQKLEESTQRGEGLKLADARFA